MTSNLGQDFVKAQLEADKSGIKFADQWSGTRTDTIGGTTIFVKILFYGCILFAIAITIAYAVKKSNCSNKTEEEKEEEDCSADGYLVGMIVLWVLAFLFAIFYYFNIVKINKCLKSAGGADSKIQDCFKEYNYILGVEKALAVLGGIAGGVGEATLVK